MALPSASSAVTHSYITSAIASTKDALHQSGKWRDIVSKANPTWDWLKRKGRIDYDGGRQLAIDVLYSTDDVPVGSFSDMDELTISRPDGASEVYDRWAQYHFPVIISGHEKNINGGKAAKTKLIKNRFKQAIKASAKKMSQDTWDIIGGCTLGSDTSGTEITTGNSNKNMKSLALLVPPTATAGGYNNGDLYGIAAAETYWAPQSHDFADSASVQVMVDSLRNLFLSCAEFGDGQGPDLAIGDYTSYGLYIAALDTKVRYTQVEKGDMGFRGVMCNGATLFPDTYVPDPEAGANYGSRANGAIYMLDTDHIFLAYLAGMDFKPGPVQMPVNQNIEVVNHFAELQLYIDHRSCHGVAWDIPTAWD